MYAFPGAMLTSPSFGAAIGGLTSIRAYKSQDAFVLEQQLRIDRYTRAARIFYNLNRWVGWR